MTTASNNLFDFALIALKQQSPEEKVKSTLSLRESWLNNDLNRDASAEILTLEVPGRPVKPDLVDPRKVPRRNLASLKGRLTLVHAIAHIEFNAINLALDAIYRFQDMPKQYYTDWCRVAAEEAKHFSLLSDYLQDHGMRYGDTDAHNGLWEMAVKTDADVLVRMALVPRVLEARGLDVTPSMIEKLRPTGDEELISILQIIFDEEIGHVKIGSYWYKTLCEQRKLDPEKTFLELIDKYMTGAKFGPFETEARLEAGFSHEEMVELLNRY